MSCYNKSGTWKKYEVHDKITTFTEDENRALDHFQESTLNHSYHVCYFPDSFPTLVRFSSLTFA